MNEHALPLPSTTAKYTVSDTAEGAHRHCPMPRDQIEPAGARAGDGDGVRVVGIGDLRLMQDLTLDEVNRKGSRCTS
jgi:hypothetical protein